MRSVKPDVRVFADLSELSLRAAEVAVRTIGDSVRDAGRCSLVLSGGNTPRTLYGLFASTFRDRSRGSTYTYSGGMSATWRLTIQTVTIGWRERHYWITSRVRLRTSTRCRLTSDHRTTLPKTMNERCGTILAPIRHIST